MRGILAGIRPHIDNVIGATNALKIGVPRLANIDIYGLNPIWTRL